MNILHWPASYPDPSRGMPYHCIFIEEHVKSVKSFANNRVLFISPESTKSNKWVERTDTAESDIVVTRFYFNRKLNLQFLNVYIRVIILLFFLELIFLKKFRPHIIHLHFFTAGSWAFLYSKLFNTKTIVTEHWTALIGYPIISSERLGEAADIYKKANWTLPVSSHLMKGIQERTKESINGKCSVIHNAVDVNIFNVTNETRNPRQLISVIRLDEQKDIPTMLNTLKIVLQVNPSIMLNIIGDGDPTPYITLAENLNISNSVQFMGALPKHKIAQLMNESALFILSSISENSPCVIGEAHCCGLPVVATDVGGVKELIIEGVTVPPKLPDLLAQKILEQLDKKIDREALAQKAQKRFSYNAIGQQIFEVYQNVCAE